MIFEEPEMCVVKHQSTPWMSFEGTKEVEVVGDSHLYQLASIICLWVNIFHCSKTGGSSTKQTHLDHWKVPKHGRLEIIFHVCEIRLWKLTQARCYQPVYIFTDFHHQDFSTIAVDTQEWNGGSWGCGWGRMQSLTLCRPSFLRWGTRVV